MSRHTHTHGNRSGIQKNGSVIVETDQSAVWGGSQEENTEVGEALKKDILNMSEMIQRQDGFNSHFTPFVTHLSPPCHELLINVHKHTHKKKQLF